MTGLAKPRLRIERRRLSPEARQKLRKEWQAYGKAEELFVNKGVRARKKK